MFNEEETVSGVCDEDEDDEKEKVELTEDADGRVLTTGREERRVSDAPSGEGAPVAGKIAREGRSEAS